MTREQRNQAKGRLEDLTLRLSALDGILATQLSSPFYRTECDKIREETQAELDLLEKNLATKWEFLFNFKSGGWNSEFAFYEEQAIEQAIEKYGNPETQITLQIDTTSFRTSTPSDYQNLLSMFN